MAWSTSLCNSDRSSAADSGSSGTKSVWTWPVPILRRTGASEDAECTHSKPVRPGLKARFSNLVSEVPLRARQPRLPQIPLEPIRKGLHGFRKKSRRGRFVYTAVVCFLLFIGLGSWLSYRSQAVQSGTKVRYTFERPQNGAALLGRLASAKGYDHMVDVTWLYEGYGSYQLSSNIDGMRSDNFLDVDGSIYTNGLQAPISHYQKDFESDFTRQYFTMKMRTSASNTFSGTQAHSSSVFYPFDTYIANASFALVPSQSNTTVPLIDCGVTSTLQGWQIISTIYLEPYHGSNFTGPGCVLQLKLLRDSTAKAITIVILCLIRACCLSVRPIFQRIFAPDKSIAATILFALPALRKSLPDAPDFGTFADIYCFLICELIVGISLVGLVGYLAVDRDKVREARKARIQKAAAKAEQKANSRKAPDMSRDTTGYSFYPTLDPEVGDSFFDPEVGMEGAGLSPKLNHTEIHFEQQSEAGKR